MNKKMLKELNEMTTQEAAEKYGVDEAFVEYVKSKGTEKVEGKRAPAGFGVLTKKQRKTINKLYEDGLTEDEIVKKTGISWNFVSYQTESIENDHVRLRGKTADIKRLYFSGLTDEEIALEYNVQTASVRSITSKLRDEAVLQDFLSGIEINELCEMYGKDAYYIKSVLRSAFNDLLKKGGKTWTC